MDGHASDSSTDQEFHAWSRELGERFLLIASLLYLATLGGNLTYVLNNQCGFAFLPGRPKMFVGVILTLLVFEWAAHWRSGGYITRHTGLWLLTVRLVLIETAATLDCSFFATMLYFLIPFLAYIFAGKWTAIFSAVLLTTWISIKFGFFRCHGCELDEYVSPMLQFGVGVLWSTVMGGLVRGVETNRAHSRKLLVDLEQSHLELQKYALQVEELAAAEERNRVARDIHDSVGHSLAVVNVQLEKALVFHGRDPDVTEQAVKDARRAARAALGDVRESVRTLRQSTEVFSLSDAVKRLVEVSTSDTLKVESQILGREADFSRPALMTLFRAAQEGLTNVHKHAEASLVKITVRLDELSAQMQIHDNGRGFEQEQIEILPNNREGRYGLQGIRERLELVGGEMSLESGPAIGTTLTVTIPKRRLIESSGAAAHGG